MPARPRAQRDRPYTRCTTRATTSTVPCASAHRAPMRILLGGVENPGRDTRRASARARGHERTGRTGTKLRPLKETQGVAGTPRSAPGQATAARNDARKRACCEISTPPGRVGISPELHRGAAAEREEHMLWLTDETRSPLRHHHYRCPREHPSDASRRVDASSRTSIAPSADRGQPPRLRKGAGQTDD